MKKGKRILRIKNKSDSLDKNEESDTEMQTEEDESVKEKQQVATSKTHNVTALNDFKLQSQIYLDRLDETYEQHAQALRLQYKNLFLIIEKDIQDLTLRQFNRLKESYMQEQSEEMEVNEVDEEEEQPVVRLQTQSPNVTSTKRTRSSNKKAEELVKVVEVPIEPIQENEIAEEAENSDEEDKRSSQPRHSELVPYNPRKTRSMLRVSTGGISYENMPGNMLTGMQHPMTNILLQDGTVVPLMPLPMKSIGMLPEISPNIFENLLMLGVNINNVAQAWAKQQKELGPVMKSIAAKVAKKK
ncbi:uncharacterized protein LOC132202404 [Neocloeon triangulifer]|uniref:uncharacterized protein LOC132202404 n=1 Tax=Neocloeon triangulifer TaxID=2078957 RepID=UPI00286F4ECE|nr:uncharacterized protein LOC132202404 [Neocloeon triangulifer]